MTKSLTALLFAGALCTIGGSASAQCKTILECAPDTTFVCRNGDSGDLRIYVSSKLKSVFYRQRKLAGETSVQDIRVPHITLGGGPGGGSSNFGQLYNLPNTEISKKYYKWLFLDVSNDNVTAASFANYGQYILNCKRIPGRHLDDEP